MSYTLKLNHAHSDQLDKIEAWMIANVGPGSKRHSNNTWLGSEDWYCYEEATVNDPVCREDLYIDDDSDLENFADLDLVFVFRRESDLLLFSLKWA